MHTTGEQFDADETRQAIHAVPKWAWAVIGLVGILVFELTANVALSATVLCIKPGLEFLYTGIWLWRADPKPGRGAACFWFSVLAGILAVVLTSLLFVAVIMIAPLFFQGMGRLIQADLLFGLGAIFAIGIATMIIPALIGCSIARKHGLKIWIHSTLHQSRRNGLWPPVGPIPADTKNFGDSAVLFALVFGFVEIVAGTIFVIVNLLNGQAALGCTLGMTLAAGVVWLAYPTTAKTFDECWPESKEHWVLEGEHVDFD